VRLAIPAITDFGDVEHRIQEHALDTGWRVYLQAGSVASNIMLARLKTVVVLPLVWTAFGKI
jgi:hypothetical protein